MPGITNAGNAQRPSETSLSIAAAKDTNANYKIILTVNDPLAGPGGRTTISANLGEKFNMEFSSSWDSPFSKSSVGDLIAKSFGRGLTGDGVSAALNAAGIGSKIKMQSAQVWSSSSPMEFSFEMVFNAIENTVTEIRNRHIFMLKLCAPSEGTIGAAGTALNATSSALGVLRSPGPNIVGNAINKQSRSISLRIGNYIYMDNIVVESVSSDVMSLMDAQGIPIQITFGVKIKSFYSCFTTQDIDEMFNSPINKQ